MENEMNVSVAIVDYGLGNLFSVKQACNHVGMAADITADKKTIESANMIILPGVGAYGDAMDALNKLDLVSPLRDLAASGKPLVGICLGQQLLLSESEEFGVREGLDIVPGRVLRFQEPKEHVSGSVRTLKVPQVGWNRVNRPEGKPDAWQGTPLEELDEGAYMYFVHSYYTVPESDDVVMSISSYGDVSFCSGLRYNNVFAFQFHPERSGPKGLNIYRAMARFAILG